MKALQINARHVLRLPTKRRHITPYSSLPRTLCLRCGKFTNTPFRRDPPPCLFTALSSSSLSCAFTNNPNARGFVSKTERYRVRSGETRVTNNVSCIDQRHTLIRAYLTPKTGLPVRLRIVYYIYISGS